MDRLQKKCFVASATGHVLLLVVFLTGSAFVSSPKKTPPPADQLQVIDFVPFKTTDELVAPGGGNRNAAPPPEVMEAPPTVTPEPPAPAPEPEPPAPAPPAKEVKPQPEPEPEPPAPEPAVREAPSKPTPKVADDSSLIPGAKKKRTFEFKKITRNSNSATAKADAKARADAEEREYARAEKAASDARKRLAQGFASAATTLGKGRASGGTKIEMRGPGGGGVPYANFNQAVKSAYDRAWHLPEGITDKGAVTVASVTIARDGTVINYRITDPSGNAAVDASVRRALERVKWVAPLPDSEKEDSRTVSINFSVSAKLGLG